MRTGGMFFVPVLVVQLAAAQAVFPVRDDGEGRNRTYDVLHYRIEVSFDEPNRTVIGKVAVTLVPFSDEFTSLELDAEQMAIRKVLFGQKELKFDLLPRILRIHLDRAYSHRDTVTVSVDYSCTPKRGLYFVQPDSAYPDKPWQIWTQGEDTDNHFWVPCYDFPNDRATSEMLITVKSNYVAVSNGELMSVREDRKKGTKTFHWKMRKPHVSYLIMLAAGTYAVLRDKAGHLPLEYYVYPDQLEDARICFSRTPDMIKFFGEKIGYAYPWEKYAQILCRDFVVGGMENTSATTLADDATVFDARARVDNSPTSLIAHELAHQWWGDLLTCKDWRHLWLNESFASYFDPLYHEYSEGRDEFDYQMYVAQQAGINVDRRLGRKPIVSVGSYGENVYPRGASVLHMLRFVLGDQKFWRAINRYITKHQFGIVETNDFKVAIEEATGENLYWFFDQWVYKAGYPVFDVSYRWSDSTKTALLSVKQTQTLDSLTGIFRTPVDIEITTAAGRATHRVNILTKDTTFVFPSPVYPDLVVFDRGNWLLKELNFSKPTKEWMFQTEKAVNPIDRLRAVQMLVHLEDTASIVRRLSQVALKDPFWAVRREAVTTLSRLQAGGESTRAMVRAALLAAATDRKPAVREAAVARLEVFREDDVREALQAALKDSSVSVVASAIRSLAKADSAHASALLNVYLDIPSYRSTVSNAAMSRLSAVDSFKAITVARAKVRYGQPTSTRFAAMGILTRYAKNHPDLMPTFVTLAGDRNPFVRMTALRTLGDIGDASTLPLLDRMAADNEEQASEAAKQGAEKIRKRLQQE